MHVAVVVVIAINRCLLLLRRLVPTRNWVTFIVTRLSDLLDFGLSKPLAIINLPKSPRLLGNFVKVSKSILFLVKSFWATFIDIWKFFLVTLERKNVYLLKIRSNGLLLWISVARFGDILPLWHTVKNLWPFWNGSFSIWQNFKMEIFIFVNGQIISK